MSRTVLVAIVVAVAVGACGGSGSKSAASGSGAGSESGAGSAGPASSAPATTFVPAFVGQGNVFFLSPSQNIGCALSETAVRCDIKDRTWAPGSKLASCDVDFGQGVTVVGTSPASLTCAGDTVLVGDEVLKYGTVVTRGDFECRSEQAAMRCRNVKSSHGFSLSREKFTLS